MVGARYMEQRKGKWDIVVSKPVICNADGISENCTFVTVFIDICGVIGTGMDIGTGLDIGTDPDIDTGLFIGTVIGIGSGITFRFTDGSVGTYGFIDYGGFFGTEFIISVVDTVIDNGSILTGCCREALHGSHRLQQR